MSAWFVGHPSERDLALFAGGEAGPLARWRVERHLEACGDCKQAVAEYFRLRERLEPLTELPEVDWNRLAEAIEARVAQDRAGAAKRPRAAAPWAWPAGAAAALALAAGLVLRQPPEAAPVVDAAPAAAVQERAEPAAAQAPPAARVAPPAVVAAPRTPAARVEPAPLREAEKAPASAALATDMLALAPPPAPDALPLRERLRAVLAAEGPEALEAEARALSERARTAPDSLAVDERALAALYESGGLDALVAELAER